jgi:hypothetical protein
MIDKNTKAQKPEPSSIKRNIADGADILAPLELLGIEKEVMVSLLNKREDLPIYLWIHDADHKIIYGNSSFAGTYGNCLKQPCYRSLMGKESSCSCCLSEKVLAGHTTEKCSVCRRNGHGYDIEIVHTTIKNNKNQTFIVKSSYHLEDDDDLAGRFREKKSADLPLFLVQCSSCDKVKDKSGNWVSIEMFDTSNVRISHGICPECTRLLYPSLDR